jgi:HAD superfamily hydrolase (TIGR01450 family)
MSSSPPLSWTCSNLSSYRCILFDCDGVLWHESTAVPHANRVLNDLSSRGFLLLFVTNNSSRSRVQLLEKFHSLGFDFPLSERQIICSSYAAAVFLTEYATKNKQFDPINQKALVIGDVGIGIELRAVGLKVLETRELLGSVHLTRSELINLKTESNIGAVIVGIDDQLTYSKVAYAAEALRSLPPPFFI